MIRFLWSDLVLEDGGAEVSGELTLRVDEGGRRGADALTENECILNSGSDQGGKQTQYLGEMASPSSRRIPALV